MIEAEGVLEASLITREPTLATEVLGLEFVDSAEGVEDKSLLVLIAAASL